MIDNTILQTDEWLTTSDYGLSFSHPIISSGIWFETLFSIKTYLTTSKGCYFLFFVLQYKLPFFLPDLFILTTQTSCQTQQSPVDPLAGVCKTCALASFLISLFGKEQPAVFICKHRQRAPMV